MLPVTGLSDRELNIANNIIKSLSGWRALHSASHTTTSISEYHRFHVQRNKLWQTNNWNKSSICSFSATIGQAVCLDLCTAGLYWFSASNYNKACYTRNNSQSKGLLLAEITDMAGKNANYVYFHGLKETFSGSNEINQITVLFCLLVQVLKSLYYRVRYIIQTSFNISLDHMQSFILSFWMYSGKRNLVHW